MGQTVNLVLETATKVRILPSAQIDFKFLRLQRSVKIAALPQKSMAVELHQVIEYGLLPKNAGLNGSSEVGGTTPQLEWKRIGTGSLVAFSQEAAQKLADKLAGETPAGDPPRRFEVRPFVRLSPDTEEPTEEDL